MVKVERSENEQKKQHLLSYRFAVEKEKRINEEIREIIESKMNPSMVSDGMPKGNNHNDLSCWSYVKI